MKRFGTMVFLFLVATVQAQYFQHHYNLDFSTPALRNERLNSGLITRSNYVANNPLNYYHVGVGTSYNNTALPAPDNRCHRLRFVQIGTNGLTQFGNFGHQYAQVANRWYNTIGNSIAEVKDNTGTGGFVAVGAVMNNNLTEANNIPGGSDMLFTRLDALGNVISARRIDFDQSRDMANCIRKSAILVNGQPTWIVCGQSERNGFTDCFVMRILVDGTIVWARRYNFDFGGGQFNSAFCISKQLCEDANGRIYVVGTIQDNPIGATGVDGLAFALTPNGAVLWANNYHAFTDDEFQAVRFTANGTLAVGGFTNFGAVFPSTSSMLYTELNIANGASIAQNILRTQIGATMYTSKCYDLTEAPGNQFYLAGALTTPNGIFEMMYRVNAAGFGMNWYAYNRMNYDIGFGIDNIDGVITPGISYFSSIKDYNSAGISDAHIMKTDINGNTCNICPGYAPSNLQVFLQRFQRANRNRSTGLFVPLIWASFNYDDTSICNDPIIFCDKPLSTASKSANNSARLNEQVSAKFSASFYPNPVTTIAKLSIFNPSGVVKVILADIDGKTIWETTSIHSNSIAIDASNLSPGMYLVIVKDEKETKTLKLVKQ